MRGPRPAARRKRKSSPGAQASPTVALVDEDEAVRKALRGLTRPGVLPHWRGDTPGVRATAGDRAEVNRGFLVITPAPFRVEAISIDRGATLKKGGSNDHVSDRGRFNVGGLDYLACRQRPCGSWRWWCRTGWPRRGGAWPRPATTASCRGLASSAKAATEAPVPSAPGQRVENPIPWPASAGKGTGRFTPGRRWADASSDDQAGRGPIPSGPLFAFPRAAFSAP
jgi:hypothetical protein